MIECKTKGIPMRDGTAIDADGFHVFKLDEAKHCPFEIFDRLATAAGAKPDPVADARFYALRARLTREARERRQ
jgi:hypothetical protein